MYLQHRLAACESPIIAEIDLYNILSSIINYIIPQKENVVDDLLKLYESIDITNDYDKELEFINTNIKTIANAHHFIPFPSLAPLSFLQS